MDRSEDHAATAECGGTGKTLVPQISRSLAAISVVTMGLLLVVAAPARAEAAGAILNEVAKLLAPDGAAGDEFGFSVAISGATAVIGAREDDGNGDLSGSAYVFVRDATGLWTQQAKLLAADGAAVDLFGESVAISGDTVVVGAIFDDDNGTNSGSAYVFVRDATGLWTQQAKLLASDGASLDWFGGSVAISGNTAVVGASGDDDNGSKSGSAYVFVRDVDGVWTQEAKLLADDGAVNDFFGVSVAISNTTVVIGVMRDDDNGINSGSAYVFTRDADSVWSPQTKLLASDGADGDVFGVSVAINGDTAVIGARGDDDNGPESGSVYVFVRDTGAWTQQAKLLPSDVAAVDHFGISVSVSDATTVVGARWDDDNGTDSGSAYVFMRDADGVWYLQTKLLAFDGAAGDQFGRSVAISGVTAVVGAWQDDDNGTDSGSAYVFDLPQGSSPDLNGDGVVDASDLATLLAQWGTAGAADLNNDGLVNAADLAVLLASWG